MIFSCAALCLHDSFVEKHPGKFNMGWPVNCGPRQRVAVFDSFEFTGGPQVNLTRCFSTVGAS